MSGADSQPSGGTLLSGRRGIWVIALLVAVVFTVYGTPRVAWAHNVLVGTTPGDGTEVKVAPATVVLTFNEPAIDTGTKMLVTGPSGSVTTGNPRLVDNTVQQDLQPGLPAGEYTVEWRVTSADGHPINGTFSFRAAAGSAGDSPTTVASPSATPTGQANDGSTRRPAGLWLFALVPIGLAGALGWRFSRRQGS